jgi:hypothetical protein
VIHAKIYLTCKGVALTSHSMSSQMQRLVGGQWVNVSSQKNESRGKLIAGTQAVFYTPSVSCVNGKYRYWANATGTGNGYTHSTGKTWSTPWEVKNC